MKIEQIQCPACGAALEIPEGRSNFFCQYCGAAVHVDDEVERTEIIHRTVDEAEIVKSNNEIEMKKLEMEDYNRKVEIYRQDRKKDLVLIAILFVIMLFFFLLACLVGN